MKNWVYKKLYIIKNTAKKYPQIGKTLLALFGFFLTIAESIHWMFKTDIIYEWMHTYVFQILVGSVIVCFIYNRIRLKYEYFIKGTDVKVSLQVTNVLNCDGAIVIPTNTTFDTLMEDEFISVNSVQGQFQKKYFENNLKTLDDLLEKGLQGLSYEELDRTISKRKKYPLGTVSKITLQGKHIYFVAIADVNEYGKPINTKFENIQSALEGIWTQLESRGHIENLAIPLIGTGKAGIKDATRERVIKEIIFSFVASSKERKITEKLIICIHPLDLEHKDLRLQEMDNYIQYMCKYRYADVNSKTEGTAL